MRLHYAPVPAPPRGSPTGRGVRAGDRYLWALGLALAGYALFSRTFAYVGVPPLYVGEAMLAAGLVALARAGRVGPLLREPAAWVLVALMALTVARTVPYLGAYGLDAPRDAMQVGYGLYAFVVGGLLVARPERLRAMLGAYGRFVAIGLALFWVVYLVVKLAGSQIPALPWAGHVQWVEAKGGDMMVHLCGMAAFLVLGLGERRPLTMALLAMNTGLIVVSNRGGMVAFALGCAAAWALRPPQARLGRLVYAFAAFLALGVLVGPTVQIHGGGRSISVEQIWLNVRSIFGQGGEHLDGTRRWRLLWWQKIYDYTVEGPYFWTGKGFGPNLAREDGFAVSDELRSPHNGHMTLLARAGVPGAALWVLLQVAWGLGVLRAWWRARVAGRHRWMAVFAFLVAYWLAAHVNGAFDVYFEGPVGAIWFWTVFGAGLAAIHLHRVVPDLLNDADTPHAPAAGVPRPWSWHAPAGGDGAAARAAGPQPLPAARR